MKVLALCAAIAVAGACKKNEPKKTTVGEVSVDELAKLITDSGQCVPVDANGEMVRAEYGVIPGAVKLSHYKKYDLSVLPKDKNKKLVFYCTNEMCGASHKAAEVASAAGHTDVNVLPAGIAGWKKSGQPTAKM